MVKILPKGEGGCLLHATLLHMGIIQLVLRVKHSPCGLCLNISNHSPPAISPEKSYHTDVTQNGKKRKTFETRIYDIIYICISCCHKRRSRSSQPWGKSIMCVGFPCVALRCVVAFFLGGHEKWLRKRKCQENGTVMY